MIRCAPPSHTGSLRWCSERHFIRSQVACSIIRPGWWVIHQSHRAEGTSVSAEGPFGRGTFGPNGPTGVGAQWDQNHWRYQRITTN